MRLATARYPQLGRRWSIYTLWTMVQRQSSKSSTSFSILCLVISIFESRPMTVVRHSVVISLVKEYSGRSCLFRLVCLQTYWVCNLYNNQNVFLFNSYTYSAINYTDMSNERQLHTKVWRCANDQKQSMMALPVSIMYEVIFIYLTD